jgi:hypothetical protein
MTRPDALRKEGVMARPLLLALLFLTPLAACDKAPGTGSGKQPAATGAPAGIPCALHGARAFGNGCSVERSTTQEGLVLILHHPDGGFRRLLVTTDGRGVVAADGSEQASVAVVGPGMIEVAIGEDRYRLPATVKGQALPAR